MRTADTHSSEEPIGADGQMVWRHLWTYCTSLFGVDEAAGEPFAKYLGSGTFVRFRGAPCLLTAAHVWERLAEHRGIGFATDVDVNLLKVATKLLEPVLVSPPKTEEWGPDIALVRLPEVTARGLERRKAFYDLARNRTDALVPSGERLWVVIGATREGSDLTSEDEALLKNRQFETPVARRSSHDGLDYTELPWSRDNPDAPTTWGGVSGAGLWVVDPAVNKGVLAGLAFYEQWPEGTERGFIRCHSRADVTHFLDENTDRPAK